MTDDLQANLRDVSFEGFAGHFHYGPPHASRFFERCTGQTFTEVPRRCASGAPLRTRRAAAP